jgi:hypothetical protein
MNWRLYKSYFIKIQNLLRNMSKNTQYKRIEFLQNPEIQNIYCENELKFKFLGAQSIKKFAENNPEKKIYIYEQEHIGEQDGQNSYIKQDAFAEYFNNSKKANPDIVAGFLKKEININDVAHFKQYATLEQKQKIIEEMSPDDINNSLTEAQKTIILNKNRENSDRLTLPNNLSEDNFKTIIKNENFIQLLKENDSADLNVIINDLFNKKPEKIENSVIINYTISKLEECKFFLEQNLNSSETDVHKHWLREYNREYRNMIFGLEYTHHKHNQKTPSCTIYDIIMSNDIGGLEITVVELKSPSHRIFDTNNTGVEVKLSSDLSRAIPQVLEYARKIKNATSADERKRLGVPQEGKLKIKKSIIVIGNNNEFTGDNLYLQDHLTSIRESFNSSLEIWTYSDLINKITITIKNLKQFSTPSN